MPKRNHSLESNVVMLDVSRFGGHFASHPNTRHATPLIHRSATDSALSSRLDAQNSTMQRQIETGRAQKTVPGKACMQHHPKTKLVSKLIPHAALPVLASIGSDGRIIIWKIPAELGSSTVSTLEVMHCFGRFEEGLGTYYSSCVWGGYPNTRECNVSLLYCAAANGSLNVFRIPFGDLQLTQSCKQPNLLYQDWRDQNTGATNPDVICIEACSISPSSQLFSDKSCMAIDLIAIITSTSTLFWSCLAIQSEAQNNELSFSFNFLHRVEESGSGQSKKVSSGGLVSAAIPHLTDGTRVKHCGYLVRGYHSGELVLSAVYPDETLELITFQAHSASIQRILVNILKAVRLPLRWSQFVLCHLLDFIIPLFCLHGLKRGVLCVAIDFNPHRVLYS